jgi:hypothetical protein
LVIIGTIAFDPFLQAVISTHGQLDNIPPTQQSHQLFESTAKIAQARNIDGGVISWLGPLDSMNTTSGRIGYVVGAVSRPDFGVVSSIYNGFQNTSAYRNDGGTNSCPTGNCTWPVFASAAFCSSCNDISNHLVVVTGNGPGGSNNRPPYPARVEGDYTAYTLPYANISNYNEGRYLRDAATWMSANVTLDPRLTLSFQHQQTLLVAFVILRVPENWLASNDSWTSAERPVATECALYLCAKAYKAKSYNNILKEEVAGSWAVKDPGSYKVDHGAPLIQGGPALDAWADSLGNSLKDDIVPRTDLRLLIPAESSHSLPATMQRSFNVSYGLIQSTMDFFVELTHSSSIAAQKRKDMMAYPMSGSGSMPPIVDALWYSTNLTKTFENVATSLTNQFRNTSPDRFEGSIQQWVIHIHVDWPYLTFPAAMILIGIIYVVLTIIESTRLHIPVWKERALPTLLHGLNDETQSLLRHDHLASKGMRPRRNVRFGYDEKEDCLRLVTE